MSAPFSKNRVKKAGKILANSSSLKEDEQCALAILDQWREVHKELFLAIPEELKGISFTVDPDAVVVARMKRIDTIIGKLRRPGLDMKLNEMCDIVGCRIITKNIDCASKISSLIIKGFDIKPGTGIKDYIEHPKANGYRSTHLICRRDAPQAGFRNLFCEMQVRTRLQHAWATALETYDVLSGNSLKFDGGNTLEKRFFSLVSGVFALNEGSVFVPGVPADMDSLREEIREINSDLYIVEKLKACSGSVTVVSQTGSFSGDAFCLLLIDYAEQKTDLFVFDTSEEAKANALYAKREKMKAGLQDALLVRVSSLSNLNEAYPNYSSDITYFLKVLEDFLYS